MDVPHAHNNKRLARSVFTPKLLSDLNCIGGFFLFHDRAYIKRAFVALLWLVMNAWLKYLSGGGGSLREGAEGVGQEVVEGGRKVEGGVGACSE